MPNYPYIQLHSNDLKEESKDKSLEILEITDFIIDQKMFNDAEVVVVIKDDNFKYIKNKFSDNGIIVKATNRYLVHFPEEMNIKSNSVSFIDLPYHNPGRQSKIMIQLQDFVVDSTTRKIYDLLEQTKTNKLKPFDITVEVLDMGNTTVEKWLYSGCTLRKVDFGGSLCFDAKNRKVVELQLYVDKFILK